MANLLINTTVGGNAVITTSNIGSYALTSLPSHTHDDRYFTETESDGRYAYKAGAAGQDFSVDKLSSYHLRNHYSVSTNHSYGMYFDNDLSTAYGIFRESGAWDHPYPDLRIAFHTGIKLGANSTYQGIKFYTDYDMVTQVMSVNNGSDPLGAGNVYVNNSLQAGSSLRAPIFYDSNDTNYYGDFAGTSNLYNLSLTGAKQTYLTINPGNGYEAMVRYIGGSGSGWYVGKRMASQVVGTESFHFYSEAAGATVAGIDTGGNFFTTGYLTIAGTQLTGTQTQLLKNTLDITSLPYKCDIYVEGNADTFYPVHFIYGNQDVWRRIIINRGYSETAPWDPTGSGSHKGGLLLDWEGNFGGWGGAEYADRLRVFNESYTNMCADMYIYTHSMGYVFMLRGGHAIYHIFSDQPINGTYQSGSPDIAYSTATKFYDGGPSYPQYDVYAPAPLALNQVNSSRIDGLRTKKQSLLDGRYLRQGVDIGSITNISASNFMAANAFYLNGQSYYLNSTNGGIYTNSRFETASNLVVGGNSYLGNASGDETHINDILRVGATDSGDAHFYFGEGSLAGSDYGSHWHWDSGYRFTWNTRNNGTDTALFYYDTNSLSYITWNRSHNINANSIDYVGQLHFNGGTRFLSYNTNYLYFQTDSTSVGGIIVRDGNTSTRGFSAYFDSAGFGLLNSSGSWGIRLNPGNVGTELFYAGDWRIRTRSDGAGVNGNLYTDQNYGYGLVGVYSSTRYQGVFAMSNDYKLLADGTGTGNLYGIAWTHTNVGGQSKSGLGHQALFMDNGTTQTAIGSGIWTNGLITSIGYGTSSNWNTAYGWGNHASAGYQAASSAITTSNIGSQSVSYATTAGALSSMNISQFSNNSGYFVSSTANTVSVNQIAFSTTNYDFTLAPRLSIGSMSIKLWDNYFNNSGLGSDYGSLLDIYGRGGHVHSQFYMDANSTLYYRMAAYAGGWNGWQQMWTSTSLTNLSQLTNGPGYLTGITSGQVTGALGYTPYNSSNPSGYISSITSGNVTTALGYTPYNSTNPSGYISSITSGNVTTALGYTPYNATNPNGYITGISFANVSSKPTTISGYGITDAITTANIGSQSVSYATTAGTANAVAWGNVSSKPGNIMYYQGFELNANTMDTNSTGFTYANNAPFTGPIARFSTGGGYDLWIGGTYNSGGNAFYLRTRDGDAGSFNAWREIITSGNIGSQSVSYASTAGSAPANGGNSSTVGGYSVSVGASANTIPTRNANGYLIPESWIQLNGIYGLYSPTNGAHLRPNDGSYGSWMMTGSRNSWQGIEFNSGNSGNVTLMINVSSNTVGFHNNSYGWQFLWESGTLYCFKNAYGGGTQATVLDSSNYSSWAQPIASAINTGNIGSQSVSYASSAGSVAWTNVSSRPTALSQFTNDLGNYGGFLTSITAHTHAISDVTGLQTALDSKQASLGFTPYNSTNPSGYITSSGSISGNAATATIASTVTVNSGNSSAAWYPIVWHSGNTVYSSSGAEIYAAGNYIRCQYINTTDNDEPGITRFVIKNGDSYHRSATTTVAADIIRGAASGSWGINVTGSAGSVAWTNVSSRPTALSQFTNDLGNYGGWITSSGSISGNAATATYATTAGSAPANGGNSATVGGYTPSGSVGANTVVIRDANNYIYAHYINSNVSETENPTINSFYTSNGDGWLRKSSVAHVKSQLGLGSMAYESSGTYQTVSGAINTGNIASQSVSYATISQQLTKYGDISGQDWNTYYINGKMIVSSVYGGSGPNFPTGAYNYGAMLSYGVTGSEFFQVYFPENGALQGGAFRKLHYRTGWNGSWSAWKSVVDQEGQVCTIAGSNQTGIEIHSNVGYNQDPLTYFLMRGQADTSWKALKIRLTGDAGGQDIEFRRIAENGTDARMWYVPRGANTVNFDYPIVQPSDSRLKDNITPISTPVDKIKSLRGVEFDWNSGEQVGTHDVGLIAQDVEAVLPEAVTTQEDGYKNLAYAKVIPLLVEAMKEQQAMIEALKAEIELLKNK